jgi:hypothetical protein
MPAETNAAGERCPSCHGHLIDGKLAIPIVGSLRFVYRLGTNDVTTEVGARMCADCGHVELRGREPDLIRRADQASAQVRPAPRWALWTRSAPGAYRSRNGQEHVE